MSKSRKLIPLVLLGATSLHCSGPPADPPEATAATIASATIASATTAPLATPLAATRDAPPRPPIDGHTFPDKVVALTWDDGPDVGTLDLAEMLKRHRVSATFFVVEGWAEGVSSDPGEGRGVFATGHAFLPVLGALVSLGHRVANHTANHVLLTEVPPSEAVAQLTRNQRAIAPFETNEARFFRAPGGAWNAATSAAVDGDPGLARLIGPIRWDIDERDWENAVACDSTRPAIECDRGGPGGHVRVKPQVTAQRYLTTIQRLGRGIVLLHDRVGHVGSSYARDVAEVLVPELAARGFVFAAPVLAFSPLAVRFEGGAMAGPGAVRTGLAADTTLRLGDVDGDGRADACMRSGDGVTCALAAEGRDPADGAPRVVFRAPSGGARALHGSAEPARGASFDLADVDGDGRADLCVRTAAGIECALAGPGGFGTFDAWSGARAAAGDDAADFSDALVRGDRDGADDSDVDTALHFADLDGDGRADVCARVAGDVVCARSLGSGFERARVWLAGRTEPHLTGAAASGGGRAFTLGDVDGDGAADICGGGPQGVWCAMSRGHAFGRPQRWSAGDDFAPEHAARGEDGAATAAQLGDLNGDGRADLCARRGDALLCAFSNGHAFLRATPWLRRDGAHLFDPGGRFARACEIDAGEGHAAPREPPAALGDVNGDGRADVCAVAPAGIVCGLAP